MLLTAGAGYGKTTVLDQAVAMAPGSVAWISCSQTERAPETLLMRILDAVALAVPGASDTLSERLAASLENVDEIGAARELLAELPRLLVEPLILVIDDAEQLEGAERSLALLSELMRAELPSLHVAVASRRPLALRVAKARTSGRLTELTQVDLAFGDEECAALIGSLTGLDPSPERVGEMMEATEGWPLGIALAAAVEHREGSQAGSISSLRSAPDLRSFFSEELLESLPPELREAAIDSSVARMVTSGVASALDLPEHLGERLEQAGMLVRCAEAGEGFTYHPLLREFLLERLAEERPDEERRRLHGAVAPAIAAGGDQIEAVEHWIEAKQWAQAVAAVEQEGPMLVRTSAGLMQRWLSLLPAESRERATIRSLQGQLAWGEGDYERAAEILRGAVERFDDQPNPPAEWLARFVLADSLFSLGSFDELGDLVDSRNHSGAGAGVLAPATMIFAAVAFATIGRFKDSDRLAEEALAHPDAALLGPVEALRLAFRGTLTGDLDEVLAGLMVAERELERSDPFNRRLYFVSTLAFIYTEHGRTDEAIQIWMRVREGAREGGGAFLFDTTFAWCAQLHAEQGRLAQAEAELAHYEGSEMGWQTCIGDLARASVASLRGEAGETLACAERALAVVSTGPAVFIHRTAAELVPVIAVVGRSGRARELLESTLIAVDEAFPRPRGRFLRGRLLALRAWLRYLEGDVDGADSDLTLFWDEAGQTVPLTLRRQWRHLRPAVWSALERGALEPASTIDSIAAAFPEGLELVDFLDHPVDAVRAAALAPATRSGDPAALEYLSALAEDPDPALADAASIAVQRLASTLPPLRFGVLGNFGAGRGSWSAAEAWERPIDARLVRFLLVNLGGSVPEDMIFDGLWPELSASSARASLQVAASRTRRVLDPPGAENSVLERSDRSYRLVLSDRDRVDAEEFRAAAEVALAESGESRRRLLEGARKLWGGEPLPEERYSDWAAAYRERLIDQYTGVLGALVEIHEGAGEHGDAAAVARDLVDLDPLNEGGHRALIAAYARTGRTGQALRQYLECRRVLVDQLGVEPAEATSRLQARILAGEPV